MQNSILKTALWLLIISGAGGCVVCFYYALQDWAMLRLNQAHFERVVSNGGDLRAITIADARQNIHRINLFADVVWALLGALITAVGLVGLCVLRVTERN